MNHGVPFLNLGTRHMPLPAASPKYGAVTGVVRPMSASPRSASRTPRTPRSPRVAPPPPPPPFSGYSTMRSTRPASARPKLQRAYAVDQHYGYGAYQRTPRKPRPEISYVKAQPWFPQHTPKTSHEQFGSTFQLDPKFLVDADGDGDIDEADMQLAGPIGMAAFADGGGPAWWRKEIDKLNKTPAERGAELKKSMQYSDGAPRNFSAQFFSAKFQRNSSAQNFNAIRRRRPPSAVFHKKPLPDFRPIADLIGKSELQPVPDYYEGANSQKARGDNRPPWKAVLGKNAWKPLPGLFGE